MVRFLLLYTGPATRNNEINAEAAEAELELWREWVASLGDALIDIGAPTGDSEMLMDDSSAADPLEISGYSIIEATDLADAQKLCAGHPFIREESGDYAISIHEIHESPDV